MPVAEMHIVGWRGCKAGVGVPGVTPPRRWAAPLGDGLWLEGLASVRCPTGRWAAPR